MKTPTVKTARNHTTNITPLMAVLIPMIFNFSVRYNLARVIKREGDTDQHSRQKNREEHLEWETLKSHITK